MTRRTQVLLVDDIDGTEAAQTLRFTVEGRTYEIDVSEAHAEKFQQALAPWIAKARRVSNSSFPAPRDGGSGAAGGGNGAADGAHGSRPSASEIRRWAVEAGLAVRVRGRLPAELRERYLEAHRGQAGGDGAGE